MGNLNDLNLDVENEAQAPREVLPPGIYDVIISTSELKDNKSGNGQHINVTFEVIDGDAKGRLVFGNWNIRNSNPMAEKIGRSELAACCKALGIMNPEDTTELHDQPLKIKVAIDKKDASRNDVKGYYDKDYVPNAPAAAAEEPAAEEEAPAAKPATAAKSPAAKVAPKPVGGGAKPWQKR